MPQIQLSRLVATDDKQRKALHQFFRLKASLALLTNPFSHTHQTDEEHIKRAAVAKNDLNDLGLSLKTFIEPLYYNERRWPDSTTAFRVLSIPELLDMILQPTEFIDILHMSETCRTIKALINDSAQLQIRLFRKPTTLPECAEEIFQSPLVHKYDEWEFFFRGYMFEFQTNLESPEKLAELAEIYSDIDSNSPVDEVKLFITNNEADQHDRKKLLRIGKQWNDMVISQPPIKGMIVTPECDCFASEDTGSLSRPISSKTGLTLGDLLVQAKKFLKEDCVWCKLNNMDGDLYDGWEYDMNIEEVGRRLKAPLQGVYFEALINLPQ